MTTNVRLVKEMSKRLNIQSYNKNAMIIIITLIILIIIIIIIIIRIIINPYKYSKLYKPHQDRQNQWDQSALYPISLKRINLYHFINFLVKRQLMIMMIIISLFNTKTQKLCKMSIMIYMEDRIVNKARLLYQVLETRIKILMTHLYSHLNAHLHLKIRTLHAIVNSLYIFVIAKTIMQRIIKSMIMINCIAQIFITPIMMQINF